MIGNFMAIALNDKRIRNFPATDKRQHIPDAGKGHCKGMTLRVYPTGRKAFYLRYRWNDSVIDYKIGDYPEIGLSRAREKAKSLREKVQSGINPMAEKRARKHQPDEMTVSNLADVFTSDYLPDKKPSTQRDYKSRIGKITRKFGRISLDEITSQEIKRWLKTIARDQPTNANRIQAIFSKMFSYGVKEGYTENHPLKGMEKVGGREKSREVYYTHNDIRSLWGAFEQQAEPLQSLMKILLLTGQRLGETSRMRWDQIDRDRGMWIIPEEEAKGGVTHVVPLSGMAIDVLENVHQLTGASEWVFESPMKAGFPLSHFAAARKRIRQLTGLPEWRPHDLRHIAITEMVSIGIDFVHVGK